MTQTISMSQVVKVATDEQLKLVQKNLRPLAQAGAQSLYDDLHASLKKALKSNPYYKRTGNLERALYQKWRGEKSNDNLQSYAVSYAGSTKKSKKGASQHAHLVEFGHTMRYQLVMGVGGKWFTAKKKEAFGKPNPKRSASNATKDKFFVLRKKGTLEVAPQPWFTPVLREGSQSQLRAQQAIENKFKELFA